MTLIAATFSTSCYLALSENKQKFYLLKSKFLQVCCFNLNFNLSTFTLSKTSFLKIAYAFVKCCSIKLWNIKKRFVANSLHLQLLDYLVTVMYILVNA